MANKTKRLNQNRIRCDNAPVNSDSDNDGDDHRGRSVLAMVGKAIHEGKKLPLEWTAKPELPCGDYKKKFCSYIGIVARERVNINYMEWSDVPKNKLNEVYDFIVKGFTVLEHRKDWILSRAGNRWRAWKSRLRRDFLYLPNGKVNEDPPTSLYPWILQPDWKKFIETSTSEKFKELSEKNRKRAKLNNTVYRGGRLGYQHFEEEIATELREQGIQLKQIPQHWTWLRAHSHTKDGIMSFKNPLDLEIAKKIKDLEAQQSTGEIVIEGRDYILARAIQKKEQGGRVRAVGSGITNKEYFGFYKPTPPRELHAIINSLKKDMVCLIKNQNEMKQNQSYMMSHIMSCCQLSQEQLAQVMARFGGQDSTTKGQSCDDDQGSSGNICDSRGQKSSSGLQFGDFGVQNFQLKLLTTNEEEVELHNEKQIEEPVVEEPNPFLEESAPYVVSCPEEEPNPQYSPSPPLETSQVPYVVPWPEEPRSSPASPFETSQDLSFPEGWSDCYLALIDEERDLDIVATGQVYIPKKSEVVNNHGLQMPLGHNRVTIINVMKSTASLPCPNEELRLVCQAKKTFVPWPSHLIFPLEKNDKQDDGKQLASSTSPSSLSLAHPSHRIFPHEKVMKLL